MKESNTTYSTALSFQLLFDQWERLAINERPETCIYSDLKNRIKDFSDLNQPTVNPSDLSKSENILGFGIILATLFPLSRQEEKKIMALSAPFDFKPLFSTAAFEEIFLDEDGQIKVPENLHMDRMVNNKMLHIYGLILRQLFDIKINEINPMVFNHRTKEGILKYYQVQINLQYVKVTPAKSLPDLNSQSEICKSCVSGSFDLEKWIEILPLDLFEFSGFVLLEAQDITESQSVSKLNEAVLNQEEISSAEFMEIVQDSVKSILNKGELVVGMASLQRINGRLFFSKNRLVHSYVLKILGDDACENDFQGIIDFLSTIQNPVLLNEFVLDAEEEKFMGRILEMGFKEIILYPLKHKDNLVGVLEICSRTSGTFDPIMIHQLNMLSPSLSIAFFKQLEILDLKTKSFIRKNFTAIHPVVEWKFDQIALDYALEEEQGGTPEIPEINFQDVFPLYGSVDIKNSSIERNKAIQDDFLIQLDLAKNILLKANSVHFLPLLDRLVEKIEEFERRIQLLLNNEEEVRISEFFRQEIDPALSYLSKNFSDIKESVGQYFKALDPSIGTVNQHRKAFELSLNRINQIVGQYLDQDEIKIQSMFPHYFEKFKTDGIEYNIYIGQSLVKDRHFDLIYLKNLRLWQLQNMIALVNLVWEKSASFDRKLETTQLILAHSAPLTISFRLDERKFDVEGGYNIRYEIIKKRIDKALIKGTNERLVQPGKIAIVYAQPKEAREYIDFIQFLQNKQQLGTEIEQLDLEEMQGVYGLKALRVTVLPTQQKENLEISELISKGNKG